MFSSKDIVRADFLSAGLESFGDVSELSGPEPKIFLLFFALGTVFSRNLVPSIVSTKFGNPGRCLCPGRPGQAMNFHEFPAEVYPAIMHRFGSCQIRREAEVDFDFSHALIRTPGLANQKKRNTETNDLDKRISPLSGFVR